MSVTKQLAEFVSDSRSIPDPVRERAGVLVLDSIACGLGALHTDLGLAVQRYAKMQGSGPERILGTGQSAAPTVAAYANARLINIIDQDETYMVLGHHANAALGASLALAETCKLDGAALLRAFTVGFEVGARVGHYLGRPLNVGADGTVAGWHFPGPALGTFAACAAASACLGLDARQVEQAFGICTQYLPVNAGEFWEAGRRRATLPTVKYEDCGINAQAGLMAAIMAGEGITGTLGAFDPDNELAQIARPGAHAEPESLVAGLGEDWRLLRTSLKPWPSCRWFHYPLTALAFALRGKTIDPASVEKVELWASGSSCFFASPEIGENTVMDASFSVPHSVAMMILGIPAGPAWFDPLLIHRDDVVALRGKVRVELEPSLRQPQSWGDHERWGAADAPMKIPCRARVTCGGTVLEATSEFALGDFWSDEYTLSADDVMAKFRTLAGSASPLSAKWKAHLDKTAPRILALADEGSVSALLAELDPVSFGARQA